ncbi:MAG: hypothetical protein VX741_12635, partial [Pseudomonadota bacterium]|nr:hypothetical protein [Pseudomonadota bacterium]
RDQWRTSFDPLAGFAASIWAYECNIGMIEKIRRAIQETPSEVVSIVVGLTFYEFLEHFASASNA